MIVGLGRDAKGERCGGQEALEGAERPEWSHGEILSGVGGVAAKLRLDPLVNVGHGKMG